MKLRAFVFFVCACGALLAGHFVLLGMANRKHEVQGILLRYGRPLLDQGGIWLILLVFFVLWVLVSFRSQFIKENTGFVFPVILCTAIVSNIASASMFSGEAFALKERRLPSVYSFASQSPEPAIQKLAACFFLDEYLRTKTLILVNSTNLSSCSSFVRQSSRLKNQVFDTPLQALAVKGLTAKQPHLRIGGVDGIRLLAFIGDGYLRSKQIFVFEQDGWLVLVPDALLGEIGFNE